MKKIILLFLLCLPLFCTAQTDEKYLEGAITFKDEKITFTTEMNVPAMTQEQVYETLLSWSTQRFQPKGNMNARILFQDPVEGSIAIGGEEYIVFSSSALSLDRSRIYYQLKLFCENGKCNIDMTRIRYWYDEARNGGQRYDAENWITDEWALNKSKTKLSPICGKFRKKTIDLKDELFKEIQSALGNKMIALGLQAAPVTPESQVKVTTNQPQAEVVQAVVAQAETVMKPTQPAVEPAKEIAPTSSEEDLIAQAVRMAITAGNDEQFEVGKECWGGFGEMFGQKVAFCFIDTQKTMGNMLMVQSESYKISFYLPNSNQAAVVIQCKKLMQNNISGEEAKTMNPNYADGKTYNMYVGAVLK